MGFNTLPLPGGVELGLPRAGRLSVCWVENQRESQETRSWLAGESAPPTVLCPFHNSWIDKARKVATEVAWVEGLLFVLREQQEPFSSTAEWHIPTGSLMKNKNNNTILHCIWLLPLQPVWTRRPLLLAFVIDNSWVAWRGSEGWWRAVGLAELGVNPSSGARWLCAPRHVIGCL